MSVISSDQGIVRIIRLDDSGNANEDEHIHVGMGMAVDEWTILTCAHVVNVALQRDIHEPAVPDDEVNLDITFPILNDENVVRARLVGWSPPGRNGIDCAVLKLTESVPIDPTILALVPPQDMINADLTVYSSPGRGHPGKHLDARLLGNVGAEWKQLEVNGQSGIQPGFSGGAVWDRNARTTIGMVIARQSETRGITGYFLPAHKIAEHFKGLVPVEFRKIPLRSQNIFPIFAILLLALTLVHFFAMQGSSIGFLVPWAQKDKELAALFGAHFFILFLGPFVMWHALKHARSFALRPWWQRVPAVFGRGPAAMLDHSRLSAIMVILFLIVIPAYAQGAFMDKVFFQKRPVFVNIARLDELKHCANVENRQNTPGCERIRQCVQNEPLWCKHQDVGLFSFIHSFPYFNHVYQVAGVCDVHQNCRMVTFFPLIQPLILFSVTLFSYVLFFMFVYALRRPWPHPIPNPNRRKNNA